MKATMSYLISSDFLVHLVIGRNVLFKERYQDELKTTLLPHPLLPLGKP